MKKVLVTGFLPYKEEQVSSVREVLRLLPTKICGSEIVKIDLQPVFYESVEKTMEIAKIYRPDYILCLAVMPGKADIAVERVAININDTRIADAKGNLPVNQCSYAAGEDAYFTTVPVKAMVVEMRRSGIPASASYGAGTFLGNHLSYGVSYCCAQSEELAKMKVGLLHVPPLPEHVIDRVGMPSMTIDTVYRGVEAAIQAMVSYDEDITHC